MEKVISDKTKSGHSLFYHLRNNNWLYRVISVLLALGLWYMTGREDVIDKTIVVPIELLNLPRDLVIASQFKRNIDITVSGPKLAIEKMNSGSVTRQVSLANAQPGTFVINNDTDSVSAPRGISVLRVQPASILLSIDKLAQKYFPVVPVTKGEVAAGFQLNSLTIEPDGISISGPETVLSQIKELRTKVIDLSGLKESKQSQVPLDLTPDIVNLIGDTSVTANIKVSAKTVEKAVSGVEVELVLNGKKQKVSPARADLLLRVPQDIAKKGVDLHKLINLTAVVNPDGETANLTATSKGDNGLKIEVIGIFPATVRLLSPPPKPPGDGQAAEHNSGKATPARGGDSSSPKR
ncbi:MAG TPA: hypothetical protein DEB25_01885 [Desulfobulbaceae bacterium]|nr:hypothetical protein [Desulfobulbaceae bacterium]